MSNVYELSKTKVNTGALINPGKIGTLELSVEELSNRGFEILKGNDLGGKTIPAKDVYPFQWLWDSCFSAISLSYNDWGRATKEFTSLFKGQWNNGMVTHIQFDPNVKTDFYPSGSWWGTDKVSGISIPTTGITQPPIIADAVLRVYRNAPNSDEGNKFLKSVYNNLRGFHHWMKKDRDPDDTGLVMILHPDESGMDDLPVWKFITDSMADEISDEAKLMARIKMETEPSGLREHRPSERYFSENYELAIRLRRGGYEQAKLEGDYPFKVWDPLFNSIWAKSNQALSQIAMINGEEDDAKMFGGWAEKTCSALNEHLWDGKIGMYMDVNLNSNLKIPVKTVSGFTPLYCRAPTGEMAKTLVNTLNNPGNGFSTDYPIPSTSIYENSFNPMRYWRGPTWPFTNWLVINGLGEYGFEEERNHLRDQTYSLASRQGYREYYHPRSGEGMGAEEFSPMAAVIVDLAHTP